MSIQSSINSLIGAFAVRKKAHDLAIRKQAQSDLDKQKIAIKQQKLDLEKYISETKRKRINLEIRKQREKERTIDGTKAL